MGRGGTHRIAHLKYGGFQMPCDLREMLQRQFYFFGTYFISERLLESWQGHARDAGIVFDVGANAGIFSLAALAVQPDAIVHAFEPTPEIAERLRQTVALNRFPNLHVHQVAVAETDGRVELHRFRGEFDSNEGMNFITRPTNDSGADVVAAICLDRFCADNGIGRIDLLKLDIQGNEHQALAGAAQLLSAGRIGTVFTELNWSADQATCPARASIRLLDEAGYWFSRPGGRAEWARCGEWMRTLSDVVARRPSHGDAP